MSRPIMSLVMLISATSLWTGPASAITGVSPWGARYEYVPLLRNLPFVPGPVAIHKTTAYIAEYVSPTLWKDYACRGKHLWRFTPETGLKKIREFGCIQSLQIIDGKLLIEYRKTSEEGKLEFAVLNKDGTELLSLKRGLEDVARQILDSRVALNNAAEAFPDGKGTGSKNADSTLLSFVVDPTGQTSRYSLLYRTPENLKLPPFSVALGTISISDDSIKAHFAHLPKKAKVTDFAMGESTKAFVIDTEKGLRFRIINLKDGKDELEFKEGPAHESRLRKEADAKQPFNQLHHLSAIGIEDAVFYDPGDRVHQHEVIWMYDGKSKKIVRTTIPALDVTSMQTSGKGIVVARRSEIGFYAQSAFHLPDLGTWKAVATQPIAPLECDMQNFLKLDSPKEVLYQLVNHIAGERELVSLGTAEGLTVHSCGANSIIFAAKEFIPEIAPGHLESALVIADDSNPYGTNVPKAIEWMKDPKKQFAIRSEDGREILFTVKQNALGLVRAAPEHSSISTLRLGARAVAAGGDDNFIEYFSFGSEKREYPYSFVLRGNGRGYMPVNPDGAPADPVSPFPKPNAKEYRAIAQKERDDLLQAEGAYLLLDLHQVNGEEFHPAEAVFFENAVYATQYAQTATCRGSNVWRFPLTTQKPPTHPIARHECVTKLSVDDSGVWVNYIHDQKKFTARVGSEKTTDVLPVSSGLSPLQQARLDLWFGLSERPFKLSDASSYAFHPFKQNSGPPQIILFGHSDPPFHFATLSTDKESLTHAPARESLSIDTRYSETKEKLPDVEFYFDENASVYGIANAQTSNGFAQLYGWKLGDKGLPLKDSRVKWGVADPNSFEDSEWDSSFGAGWYARAIRYATGTSKGLFFVQQGNPNEPNIGAYYSPWLKDKDDEPAFTRVRWIGEGEGAFPAWKIRGVSYHRGLLILTVGDRILQIGGDPLVPGAKREALKTGDKK
jgi:hypothetical protein